MFSWIPIYTELAKKVLSYREKQNELIKFVKEFEAEGLPVGGSTLDTDVNGQKIPLVEMDPFTFFSYFNRSLKDENRIKMLALLKASLKLEAHVPDDFEGVPLVHSQNAWFFPYEAIRKEDDIPSLWDLATAVSNMPPESLNPQLFERCLQIHSVGSAKLTMGMFWLNPKDYLALDSNNQSLFARSGIHCEVDDYATYLAVIGAVKTHLGANYPEISRTAFKEATEFQQPVISEEELAGLWSRFRKIFPDFVDFTSPGHAFLEKEVAYKRNIVKLYQEEVGNTQLSLLVKAGQGMKALNETRKRIQTADSPFVSFYNWGSSIGDNDQQSAIILKSFLDAAETAYAGPSTIQPIIQATLDQGLSPSWDTLTSLLWVMRPTDYFPVKISTWRQLAKEVGHPLPEGEATPEKFDEVMQFARAFRDALTPQQPADWIDVQSFIWVVSPGTYAKQAKYWAGGCQWGEISKLEEFINGNVWQIGWDKKDTKTHKGAKEAWANFEKVNVGDHFAFKSYGGTNDLKIHYLGMVEDKSDDGMLHLKKLEGELFKGKGPKGVSWFGTLVPIKVQSAIDAVFPTEGPGGSNMQPSTDLGALNRILYGPPGTGKTYSTIETAVRIADPGFAGNHAAQKQRFDELLLEGRVEFITFHQSYSYEDFVEGIRPVLDADEENTTARYECRPGAFKRLAFNALFDCLVRDEVTKGLVLFDALWTALISKIDSDPEAKYPGLSSKTSYQFSLTQKGNIEGTNVLSSKTFLCSRKLLEQVFDAKRDRDSIVVADVMEVVARGCHSQLVAAVFNELRRIEKKQFAGKVQPGLKTAYTRDEKAEIVQRFLAEGDKSGYQLRQASRCTRYVLVIDEINRGNISKILGELITLIETDKRLGTGDEQNSLIVTLPYSGEKFAIPANLYIVGTMNTADKSIALVDLALRRRFEFQEMPVRMDLCNGLSDQMRLALTELNRRITLRKDRDHQIGHAYFIHVAGITGFNQQFRKQIIPLLQEYFYNDWEGVRYVLGETATDGRFISKLEGSDTKELQRFPETDHAC